MIRLIAALVVSLAVLAGACQSEEDIAPTRESTLPTVAPIDSLPPSVRPNPTTAPDDEVADPTPRGNLGLELVRSFPHDANAWTQGYVIEDGRIFESTGDWEASESTLREIDPISGETLRSVAIGEPYFSEGIEIVGDEIIMITWQDNTAFVFDKDTFEVQRTYTYDGEGWGLCLDDATGPNRLVMSDGSATLTFRDPATFEITGTLEVAHNNQDELRLNELECVDGFVYANVWTTNTIVRIDLATGNIVSAIDASVLKDRELGGAGNILNGIAYDERKGTFLLTGKFWPAVFEVRFVSQ